MSSPGFIQYHTYYDIESLVYNCLRQNNHNYRSNYLKVAANSDASCLFHTHTWHNHDGLSVLPLMTKINTTYGIAACIKMK